MSEKVLFEETNEKSTNWFEKRFLIVGSEEGQKIAVISSINDKLVFQTAFKHVIKEIVA